ncbi:MAG: FAD-binding oxidoreductase, partial [Proteobacteria bacterium]|nr:FAD-binding oxidoreductase [Pseudomonadota bacterium]
LEVIKERYQDYLRDESNNKSEAVRAIYFPGDYREISGILSKLYKEVSPFRISGGRTGLASGAVPEEDEVLISLSKMKQIKKIDEAAVIVESGVTLTELQSFVTENYHNMFFPVDPTEWSATIGGMVSTNASGSRTYFYGPMRNWVNWIRAILPDGQIIEIRRGESKISDNKILFEFLEEQKILNCRDFKKPNTKNTLGYSFQEGQDVIDLFLGSEGTLCVISDIELRLVDKPTNTLSYLQFFKTEDSALEFVNLVRGDSELKILAIEYLDKNSLRFALQSKNAAATQPAQLVKEDVSAAVFLECVYEKEEDFENIFSKISEIIGTVSEDMDNSFAGIGDKELRDIKIFRHAVPEQINSTIAKRKIDIPTLHKIATDMAVENRYLKEIYFYYKQIVEDNKLEYAIFGHAGNNHFHVNILPKSEIELKLAKSIYLEIARKVVSLGGAVASEHGIGKLKRDFLQVQYQEEIISQMKSVKLFFDPSNLLNRGILFDEF